MRNRKRWGEGSNKGGMGNRNRSVACLAASVKQVEGNKGGSRMERDKGLREGSLLSKLGRSTCGELRRRDTVPGTRRAAAATRDCHHWASVPANKFPAPISWELTDARVPHSFTFLHSSPCFQMC